MLNLPFRALMLGYPSEIECEAASELFPETFPKTSRIRLEFSAREGLPPLKLWWYDGNPFFKEPEVLRPGENDPGVTKVKELMEGKLRE